MSKPMMKEATTRMPCRWMRLSEARKSRPFSRLNFLPSSRSPSGVGVSKRRLLDAFKKAREGDPVSAYGGVIGFNRAVTGETAREVAGTFFEAIIAPSYDREARKILSAKANLRVLATGGEFRWSGAPARGGPTCRASWRGASGCGRPRRRRS